jgi:hypothetical protein
MKLAKAAPKCWRGALADGGTVPRRLLRLIDTDMTLARHEKRSGGKVGSTSPPELHVQSVPR